MRRQQFLFVSCYFAAVLFSSVLLARTTYYVAKSGSDNNDGSIETPFYSVNFAITKLKPGDTLYLRAGTYYETVEAAVSGTAAAPIVIASAPDERAAIDSGYQEFRVPGNSDWELVNAQLGEYRSNRSCTRDRIYGYVLGIPGYVNERVVLVPYRKIDHFRALTDKYDGKKSKFYVGPGTIEINRRCHIRLAKTEAMRNAEARYGEVLSAENADPRNYKILLSQESNTLTVKGGYLTFKNLTINQAQDSIELESGAHHVVFDGVTAWMGDTAFATHASDVHHITITRSQVLGDAPYWIFWSDMKDLPLVADRARGTSINLKGGSKDWTISWNLIRGSGQDLIATSNGEDRIFVHHNRIENCGDDAFEIEGVAEYGGTADIGQIVIHDNHISNCLTAVAVGQGTENMTGPLLFYRNLVTQLRDHPVNRGPGINSWNGGGQFGYGHMFKQAGSDYPTRNVHYYQNTLVMLNSHNGIVPTPTNPDGSTFANNIVVMVNGEINKSYNLGSEQLIDGNLYWKVNTQDNEPLLDGKDTVGDLSGIEQNSIGDIPKRGTDPLLANFYLNVVDPTKDYWALHPDSEAFYLWNFIPSANSPVRAKAVTVTCRNVSGQDEFGNDFCLNDTLPDPVQSGDIGAIPSTAIPSDYEVFPFDPSLAVPSDPPGEPPLPPANNPPVVSAGVDQSITLPNNAVFNGNISDDGLPNDTLTSTWTKLSGAGQVSFTDASKPNTTASFSMAGTYVLQLTGDDGELQSFDEVSISVGLQNGVQLVSKRIEASTDDAEERSNEKVDRNSSDLELVYDRSNQTVGMRFNSITIPRQATIVNAFIQFQTDEQNSEPTSLVIEGEATDSAAAFMKVNRNISSRARTGASVSWEPAPWLSRGEAGLNQRTPDLTALIQEIIDRPGWINGNSLVIIVTGTGERVAESFNGDEGGAPLLYVEYMNE